MLWRMRSVRLGSWLVLLLATAADVSAQTRDVVGPYVVDARGVLARFKGDAAVAAPLAVAPDDLPTRGLGGSAGAHAYVLRGRRVTLGLGGEVIFARGGRTAEPTTAVPEPPAVRTRFTAMVPHLSLNFGRRDGWSYVSGGIGRARLSTVRDDRPGEEAAGARALHYGGGARWFTGPHLAFTFDVRFYTVNAQPATGTGAGYPRTRFMVFSAGASFR